MEKRILISFVADYADEFDVEGFTVLYTEEEWKQHLRKVEDAFEDSEFESYQYFGTNEAVEYEDFDSYYRCFTVTEITEEEYQVILKLFNGYFGKFLTLEVDE